MLELARTSYQLRDDDNIYLGRIEAQLLAAIQEARHRLEDQKQKKGKARIIQQHSDLSDFRHGEVLVCDAVDPNMTFVVPLASAVVERRGGMLIHGAIIAREYGLPCVTGIPDATALIQTGDEITVDGYLGIVTVGSADI